MRKTFATALLVLAAAAPSAGAAEAPSNKVEYTDGHSERYLLGGTWLFRADPEDAGLRAGWQNESVTDSWSRIKVPSAFNAGDDSPDSQRGSIGWYRRDFTLPRSIRRGDFKVRFEAVNYRATVFLNGTQVGTHEGGYIPFEVPARLLDRDGVNRLVVRVDSRRGEGDLPPLRESVVTGLPGGGWWNYGGLIREVYLRRYSDVDLEELHVDPQLPCASCAATVRFNALVRNDPGGARKVRLVARIAGRTVRTMSIRVPSNRSRVISTRVRIPKPRLWSPRRPRLQAYSARLISGRRTLSAWTGNVGIRRVEVDSLGRVKINGKRVIFRGASIHEDHPLVGAALTKGARERLFKRLRRLNGNITRAHYPLHPQFYELADRAGVVIWDQVPFYRIREELITPSVRAKGLAYLEAMIRRDRNHPSVIAYSVANELSRNVRASQERYLFDARKLIDRLDPSRLSAIDIAGYPSQRLVRAYRGFEAIGTNAYFGWYPGPVGSVLNREVLGPYLDQLHQYYPNAALFVTEFGAEANRNGPREEKGTFDFQTDFMRDHLATYDSKPYLNGAIAWILQDFKVRPGWDGYNRKPSPPYNKKGLIDELGNRKPAFNLTARSYKRAIANGARHGLASPRSSRYDGGLVEIAQSTPFIMDRVRVLAIFRTLDYGEKAYLSGQFRHQPSPDADTEPYADRQVTLEEAPYPHDVWTPVATGSTDQEGYYFFTRRPEANVRYRVRTADPAVVSSEPIVRVRLKATAEASASRVREGRTFTLTGAATPAHPGGTVIIQRRVGEGKWRDITRTAMRGPASRFSKRIKPRETAEYRVRMPADADHLPGTSGVVRVVVGPKRGDRR
ncbi:MAG TPA: glycoside hydrolase family 2 TIM barrel-domain containing protein [Thermoleophilaceae bacterium]|nr:glycoside hydrolase family 2 TIM barrel-domain containing protein [Thermoleophilaceae bacterium]